MILAKEILDSFNITGEIVPLSGGQNTSVRVGKNVLKPVDDVMHYEWQLTILDRLNSRGYRLSKPVKCNKGTFVSDGWICTQFERGEEVKGHIHEKLQASRLFHQDLSKIDVTDLPQVENAWAKAHRIAWQAAPLPLDFHTDTRQIIDNLLLQVRPDKHYDRQIVHADLAGNILFSNTLPPLIIDFSPTVAPVEYAEAILVCDCIAWQGSKVTELGGFDDHEMYREMMIRAVVFRLAVEAIFSQNDFNRFLEQYRLFKPIIDYIQ